MSFCFSSNDTKMRVMRKLVPKYSRFILLTFFKSSSVLMGITDFKATCQTVHPTQKASAVMDRTLGCGLSLLYWCSHWGEKLMSPNKESHQV